MHASQSTTTRREEIRAALSDIAAPSLALVPIGVLFGAVATAEGLSAAETMLMSGFVFAGGAQFAAIEIWADPVPVAAIVFSTLLINLRHVLMSASLAPRTGAFATWQRIVGFHFLADETWALAERRAAAARLTPTYYFTMIALFFPTWLVTISTGAVLGARIGDPQTYGADFAFPALFIALIAALWKGPATGVVVAASAVAAACAAWLFGPPWHVPAGAVAGIAAAALAWRPDPLKERET
ncbi:AzlC family ABC transporter permease [Salinarimonas ramus]|uniref:Branched-chain amino acid ABC transporter permease n=1 Tax=Salinarimonas ramus TaxID=690164 RepID=A0A917Q811_9HYPH|nr:AzlC family ABC transporter permease [Salinarimonas ramus]GGK33804.1 branched-chain amino acid ABC transporter permease [Salinarimonas ramus]